MIKLYGFPVSNYYNMVKLALLEKGFEFEEVTTRPSQEAPFLAKSPMGKIPCLEVNEGAICETNVILEFIEDMPSDTPLWPTDLFQRAKAREVAKVAELYLELVLRQTYGAAFFGGTLTNKEIGGINEQLDKGIVAARQLLRFEPYAVGDVMSYADIVLYYTVTLGAIGAQKILNRDLIAEIDGLVNWLQLMDSNPLVQTVNQDRDQALQAMMSA